MTDSHARRILVIVAVCCTVSVLVRQMNKTVATAVVFRKVLPGFATDINDALKEPPQLLSQT